MLVVLDTNILISALITKNTPPDKLYQCWQEGMFQLATSTWQCAEFERVYQYPKLQKYLKLHEAETMLHHIKEQATFAKDLPDISMSPDPDDDFILATALATGANYLVTGDKSDLLPLLSVEKVRIVTATTLVNVL